MSSRIADVPVPPGCRETIRAGALVAVSHSGGKHSQAMTILLSRMVPPDRLLAVHAPLGEVELQWPIMELACSAGASERASKTLDVFAKGFPAVLSR